MKTTKSKLPKQPKAPKSSIKVVRGYVKKDETFINPYIKGLSKF